MYQVFEENLDDARDDALALLSATRQGAATDQRRYEWLYRENPDGNAVLWSIRKAKTAEMAGFTVVLPRRMIVDGAPRLCWIGADFSIYPKYRSLGVAMKLRRAAKTAIDEGRASFLYAHPNERMQIIHEKVGHAPVGTMVRYAKPLRFDPYLRKRLGDHWLSTAVGKLCESVTRLRSREGKDLPSCSTRLVESPRFDDRFDRLFEQAATCRRVIGVRDSRYLDWRYTRNPLYKTHALLAEDGDRLIGYALFVLGQDGVVQVKDVFAAQHDSVERDLIGALIAQARRDSRTSISIAILEGHPIADTLGEFGFVRRPDCSQMVSYAPPDSPLHDVLREARSWLICVGDRDV